MRGPKASGPGGPCPSIITQRRGGRSRNRTSPGDPRRLAGSVDGSLEPRRDARLRHVPKVFPARRRRKCRTDLFDPKEVRHPHRQPRPCGHGRPRSFRVCRLRRPTRPRDLECEPGQPRLRDRQGTGSCSTPLTQAGSAPATVTASNPDPPGSPVAGAIRWWTFRPPLVQRRRRTDDVATAPWTTSSTASGSGSPVGSSIPTRHEPPSGGRPPTTRSPPASSRKSRTAKRRKALADHRKASPLPIPPRSTGRSSRKRRPGAATNMAPTGRVGSRASCPW